MDAGHRQRQATTQRLPLFLLEGVGGAARRKQHGPRALPDRVARAGWSTRALASTTVSRTGHFPPCEAALLLRGGGALPPIHRDGARLGRSLPGLPCVGPWHG